MVWNDLPSDLNGINPTTGFIRALFDHVLWKFLSVYFIIQQ